MTESYLTPEKLEAFVREYRASKTSCWACDQIVRKIKEKTIIGDSDRYHMVICRPKLKEGEKSSSTTKTNDKPEQRAAEKAVEFHASFPQAKRVSVAGDFNKWNVKENPLKKDSKGNWNGWVALKPGRYQYRFYVDGKWADDSQAKETVSNGLGSKNAVLEVK